jgi:hypothetical protein
MKYIYSAASTVLVWLGSSESLDTILRKMKGGILAPVWHAYSSPVQFKHSPLKLNCRGLFEQPWFSRMWVVQEVALAKHVSLLGGESVIEWDTLVRLAAFLLEGTVEEVEHNARCSSVLQIQGLRELFQIGRSVATGTSLLCRGDLGLQGPFMPGYSERPEGLVDLFEMCRHYEATDPRDKIYGLLGLAEECLIIDSESCAIGPDYSRSQEEVFLQTAQELLKGPEPLKLLRNTERNIERSMFKNQEYLPSWAPDWSLPNKANILSELCCATYCLQPRSPLITNHPFPNILQLGGKYLSRIQTTGNVWNHWTHRHLYWKRPAYGCNTLQGWDKLEHAHQKEYTPSVSLHSSLQMLGTTQPVRQAEDSTCNFWRIVIAGTGPDGKPAHPPMARFLDSHLDDIEDEQKSSWHAYQKRVFCTYHHRRFFVTQKRRFYCLIPRCASSIRRTRRGRIRQTPCDSSRRMLCRQCLTQQHYRRPQGQDGDL